jgi:16S rRNA (cytosine967-C5)-methyltransferase
VKGPKSGAQLRALAAQVVAAVASQGQSLDTALANAESDIAEADRPLLRLLSYGTVRHYWRLGEQIGSLLDRPLRRRDSVVHALLAVGLYQLADTRVPDHAAVSETVEAVRMLRRPRHASLVNAVLRRALRDRVGEREPSGREAKYDHPAWLLDSLAADWPAYWRDIVAANNRRAPMWLRANTRHGNAADYLDRLEAAGIGGEWLPAVPGAVRLDEPVAVDTLPGFREGHVSIQDAAAQLAAPWLLESGVEGRVLDACAAPGGKSGHLLELGRDRIALTCVDSDPGRLDAVAQNLDRLQFDATLIAGDASKPERWWDGKPFSAILVDAPCSASGVIRRHPDIKLLRRPADIAALASTQSGILEALWPLLEPGGRLLYVTCSVLAAENDEVVAAFIGRHDDAREGKLLHDYNIRDLMRNKTRGYQVLPGTADMDGFYYASLLKAT